MTAFCAGCGGVLADDGTAPCRWCGDDAAHPPEHLSPGLARCRECGAPISAEAASCPRCGAPDPAGAVAAKKAADVSANQKALGGCCGVIVLLAIIGGITSSIVGSTGKSVPGPVDAPVDSSAQVRADSIMKRTPVARVTELPTSVLDDVIGAIHDPDSASRQWYAAARKERDRRTVRNRIDAIEANVVSACHSSHATAVANLVTKHADWADGTIASVACRYVSVGMTAEQLRASWGRPEEINRTVVGSSTSDQWVYGDNYVYVEDGVVTSYQVTH